jgi:hypothetical protein
MPDGLLTLTGGHVPYTERDLFDAVLTGRTDTIPDALRPVADTLNALRAAPAGAELTAEAAARAEFRVVMRQARTATTPDVPAVAAHTLALSLPAPQARPRRSARHRHRRSPAGPARLLRPTVLLSAAAAAAVVVLAIALTSVVPRSLHSIAHSGNAASPKSPAARGTAAQTSLPTLNGGGKAVPTPTPTPPPTPATLCREFFNLLIEHPQSAADRQQEEALGKTLTKMAGGTLQVWGYCARALASQDHRPPVGFPNGQGNPFAPSRGQQGTGAAGSQNGSGGTGNQGGAGPRQP